MPITHEITVDLAVRSYKVAVGVNLLGQVGAAAADLTAHLPDFGELSRVAGVGGAGRTVVITDSTVGPLYADTVADSLARLGWRCDVIEFPPGEEYKNLTTYGGVMDELLSLDPPIDRKSVIVALGGGVVGDLAGFVAATALRGLSFINVPTTLLADVDAAVGGKTGLNASAGKNLIGAFHQPGAVIIDAAVLKTLPAAELGNGLAECVKHGVIRDDSLLDFIEDNVAKIMAADADTLAELIARNVAIKAAVVSADEREAGQRSHLNFGHTIAHAVETAAGYGVVSHGQAVALGMVAAFHVAQARSLISSAAADRIREILAGLSLPVGFDDLPLLPDDARDPDRLRGIMSHDKKTLGGVVRFVLPVAPGSVAIFDDVTDEQIASAIAALQCRE